MVQNEKCQHLNNIQKKTTQQHKNTKTTLSIQVQKIDLINCFVCQN